jgi:PKD domain-containing protein
MRLATRALTIALASLVLCATVSAQTLRAESDPRNQSPSVGTGGPEGGPTGLFTVYDGSTIRKGEFTISFAYSNFDRDPGNVDITDIPLSFNVGLNDHIELFFKTNAYRGIKLNSPQNISSFYLPNVGGCGSVGFCSLPAIILAPTGPSVGNGFVGTVFRPFNNQPFVQFPFVGGSAGTFGGGFGTGFVANIGTPITNPNSGNFGPADTFPGLGSPVGSILPGIVLATATIPGTLLTRPITVPTTFTVAPSYLPDAPFVSRLYGESSFTNFVVGGKIRFTGPNNALGVGLIPFYRWYPDKGDDLSGFNQLQRGAGPGGDIGDFGLVGFVDGRLSRSVNLSANFGYILNSNPKGPNDVVLLDRPNEIIAGVGFDFPINKHFQPIFEVRSTQYVGGRTINVLENNPVDALGGVKIYPRRWWGIGAAYRIHVNQQDHNHFKAGNISTINISQVTNVTVPGQGVIVVPGTTVTGVSGGVPNGFRFSEDPHGFIGQFWIGHRNARALPPPPNQPPTVSVTGSAASITLPCPEGTQSATCTPSATREIQLTADARDPDNDTLLYTWSVTGGRLSGEGRMVTWDLSGVNAGSYTATVEVNDGNNHTERASTTVAVAECTDCVPPCPNVAVSCPSDVEQGSPITFSATVQGGASSVTPTYNWSVSAGTITSGQGTSSITVDTAGLGGQTVTATVEIGGYPPACAKTASCSAQVKVPPQINPIKFDEYGNIRFNDEKARLDNYAIQLQNQPGSQGYIIAYGTCVGEGQARADRAKNYLVNTRGIEAGRITTVDGGCRSDLTVELWIAPPGATTPAASTDNIISPCPECKKRGRRRARRGDDE